MELIQKMFLERIIEHCKIEAYWVRKGIWIECHRTRNWKKSSIKPGSAPNPKKVQNYFLP